ncbi:glycosyltransferase family 9 protein [Sphingobacterium endophyticum]|uniref:glycosyltransferase family 9 protein n=1 Tax=Sphingobacterium endophyticum TaxID=2546448 RepID=UPI0012E1CB8D|nr:glycosyltransferase family 9 protein [Sphingobacterium endophyticum]
MKRILVTRFSAMGDVAMVASVLREFQEQHTDTEIIMVSRPFFSAFFEGIPRLKFHPIDPKNKHKGIAGLFKLYKELKSYKATQVADLHNNLRSRFLDILFKISGYTVQILDKGRAEKKALTRSENKIFKPLKLTTERYADVFRQLGYTLSLSHQLQKQHRLIPPGMMPILASNMKKIGISAFAQHPYKVLSKEKMGEIIRVLSEIPVQIILFGGGSEEAQVTEGWEKQFSNVRSIVGQYNLSQELDIIAHLDLMISMDSSGMHMASLMGVSCVSIWGATHPYAGFLGYGQSIDDCVQVEHPSRPSSIYGNKACPCDGIEAIDLVTSGMVVEKVKLKLNL